MTYKLPDTLLGHEIAAGQPTLWVNPSYRSGAIEDSGLPVSAADVVEAQQNWERLAPLLEACFAELRQTAGVIRSELVELRGLRDALGYGSPDYGRIFIKADNNLPVAGSIKARGGVYEVFLFAEKLAREMGLLAQHDDIRKLASDEARTFFSKYTVAVGSTGNLGLSVGIAARALGFKATVHMSSDAKQWKVDRLTRMGVDVVKHDADYTIAVENARIVAEADSSIYFVDDEKSRHLFLGYSVAAFELAEQLNIAGVIVDEEHPLFLYLPCGIGGAPGGVAFGAKAVFGDNVHPFFVEPAQSPCALVHMMSGQEELVSVYDVGLTNKTEADGMAVARMSAFVATVMREMLAGVYTVSDNDLLKMLLAAHETEGWRFEPSATAALRGPEFIACHEQGKQFTEQQGIQGKLSNATHIMWATGGSFVPEEQFQSFLKQAKEIV